MAQGAGREVSHFDPSQTLEADEEVFEAEVFEAEVFEAEVG